MSSWRHHKTLVFLDKSLAIGRKIGDVHGEANQLIGIGWSYIQMGKYDKNSAKY